MLRRDRIAEGRPERIERLLSDLEATLDAGGSVDLRSVEKDHAELMPELTQRLRALGNIEQAAQRAQRLQIDPHTRAQLRLMEDLETDELQQARGMLPDFDVQEVLHRGGQGVVFKAVQRSSGQQVAIKVLLEGFSDSLRQRQRFDREIELVSGLRHPNIVRLMHSGLVDGRPYYVMEFIDGLSIDAHVTFRDLKAARIVLLFLDVCDALTYAHQRGIIHRDLKPSNILVDAAGQPRIVDFGLAKAIGDAAKPFDPWISMPGSAIGTLPYQSPEQVDGSGDVDVRTDVYALGVVMFEVLTGEFPYPVDDDPSVVRLNILERRPASFARDVDALDRTAAPERELYADLEAILHKALAKDKGDRYQSVEELAKELRRSLEGQTVQARAHGRLYRMRKFVRRYRLQVTLVAITVIGMVGASALITTLWQQARRQRDSAQASARVAQSVLNTMLNDVIEKIVRLPGGVAVRDDILDGIAAELDQLEPFVESEQVMGDLRADWYSRRGDVARIRGLRAAAEDYYRRHVELRRRRAEDDPSLPHRIALVGALATLAMEAKEWEPVFQEAVILGRELIEASPDDSALRWTVCKSHREWAKQLLNTGQYLRAAEQTELAFELATPIMQATEMDDWPELIADLYMVDGIVRDSLGDSVGAERSFEESLTRARALYEDRPYDTLRVQWVMNAATRLATIKQRLGRPDEAEGLFLQSVDLGLDLVEREPENSGLQLALYSTYYYLVSFLHARLQPGDAERGVDFADAGLAVARSLLSLEPDNQRWRSYVAMSLERRGRALLMADDPEPAYEQMHEAVRAFEALRGEGLNDAVATSRLGSAYHWLGRSCESLGLEAEAREHYSVALDIRRDNYAANPSVVLFAKQAIETYRSVADWHLRQGTPEGKGQAEHWYGQAKAVIDTVLADESLGGRRGEFEELAKELATTKAAIP